MTKSLQVSDGSVWHAADGEVSWVREVLVKLDSRLTPAYQRLFQELANKRRYRTYSVGKFYIYEEGRQEPERVNVVVRVDVDSALHLAVPLPEALSHCDASTHCFLTHPHRYYNSCGSLPLRQLKRAHPGQVVHLTFHTKNAFRYWENWSAAHGELAPVREAFSVFLYKAAVIRWRQSFVGRMVATLFGGGLRHRVKELTSAAMRGEVIGRVRSRW